MRIFFFLAAFAFFGCSSSSETCSGLCKRQGFVASVPSGLKAGMLSGACTGSVDLSAVTADSKLFVEAKSAGTCHVDLLADGTHRTGDRA